MIHTSYVPLDPPYRVIEYNTTLGIQIGSLIVTKELETKEKDGYSIETHSHPVVSYVNNQYQPEDGFYRSLSPLAPVEGVVWDKVEVGEVNTIARVGDVLKWEYMMDVFKNWRMAQEIGLLKKDVPQAIMETIGRLYDWNVKIDNPIRENSGRSDNITVELSYRKQYGKTFIVGEKGLGLAVLLDSKDIFNQLTKQAHWIWATLFFYHTTNKTKKLRINFVTSEKSLIGLMTELNVRFMHGITPDCFNSSHYDGGLMDGMAINKDDNNDGK